jgi:hypothetical protein
MLVVLSVVGNHVDFSAAIYVSSYTVCRWHWAQGVSSMSTLSMSRRWTAERAKCETN